MKIGIIGLGIVGGATRDGFQKLGHNISIHDIALDTHIDDILETELCFVCVPTPSKESGECDTTIVESVVKDLCDKEYRGIICIKSTVSPGTTEFLKEKYGNNICFVPEFLRERCATEDFINNHDVCIIGTSSNEFYSKIKEAHGNLPQKVIRLTETEAEFCKYFNNSYNATLITFANSFYELCKSKGVNYKNIKDAISNRKTINDFYLDCSEDLRGFGGMCLPKDTKELAFLSKKLKTTVEFFDNILKENEKYKTTVFKGMRE
jgi:UDPglucose 6-dehydrogenase